MEIGIGRHHSAAAKFAAAVRYDNVSLWLSKILENGSEFLICNAVLPLESLKKHGNFGEKLYQSPWYIDRRVWGRAHSPARSCHLLSQLAMHCTSNKAQFSTAHV